jgi:hypothetical protein
MNPLGPFSDWMLALLPRLFLYPGGLWLLGLVVLMRLVSGVPGTRRVSTLVRDFAAANTLSLAVAWVAVALLPLPGANPLPAAPDRLVLTALPLVSLLLSAKESLAIGRAAAVAGLTLALLVPLLQGRELYLVRAEGSLSVVLATLAVGVALVALWADVPRDLAASARWLAWLGLGLQPLLLLPQTFLPDLAWAAALYLLALLVLTGVSRLIVGRVPQGALGVGALVVAVGGLLAALLGF